MQDDKCERIQNSVNNIIDQNKWTNFWESYLKSHPEKNSVNLFYNLLHKALVCVQFREHQLLWNFEQLRPQRNSNSFNDTAKYFKHLFLLILSHILLLNILNPWTLKYTDGFKCPVLTFHTIRYIRKRG